MPSRSRGSSVSQGAPAEAYFCGDDVLSTEMRQRMLSRQGSDRGFGLGVEELDGHTVARHSGWFAAHRSHLLLDAEAGIAVVVMANSDDGAPRLLAESLLRIARTAER